MIIFTLQMTNLKRKLKVYLFSYNAVCLWRTYLQLKDKFGTKVIDYKQIGINTKNARLDSSCELQRLVNSWGYDIVNIADDGNCFFTAVAFQLHQLMTTINKDVPENALHHLKTIGISPEETIPDIAKR